MSREDSDDGSDQSREYPHFEGQMIFKGNFKSDADDSED